MSEWQEIETAPKDGTRILVSAATEEGPWVGEVSWCEDWYRDKSRPGWILANCDEEYGQYMDATHWMPLPEPPVVGETLRRKA